MEGAQQPKGDWRCYAVGLQRVVPHRTRRLPRDAMRRSHHNQQLNTFLTTFYFTLAVASPTATTAVDVVAAATEQVVRTRNCLPSCTRHGMSVAVYKWKELLWPQRSVRSWRKSRRNCGGMSGRNLWWGVRSLALTSHSRPRPALFMTVLVHGLNCTQPPTPTAPSQRARADA